MGPGKFIDLPSAGDANLVLLSRVGLTLAK